MKKIFIILLLGLSAITSTQACYDMTNEGQEAFYEALSESTADSYYNYKKDSVCDSLEDYSKKLYNTLLVEEVLGIYGYTTNDFYKHLNRTLRSGKVADKKKYGKLIDVINTGLDKLPNFKGEVVRFEKKKSISRFGVGKIKTFKAYTSTSKKKDFCWKGNVKFRIKSKTGKFIGMISAYKSEQEVLFPPKKKFKVIKVKKAPKDAVANCHDEKTLNVIWMEEV
ncbi:ADP-ribosyltransferase [Bacteriovorax sp. DB6_IX]|uniref:ADP-ribosyltransferase n=1 Tax=Bacteriovorax sp. DB6_IX TaxID=1353530 RepID=UPI00038A42D7|nr:ADP-ribosyltransferase [Bacteriovorax sp. DB6_IX]EQC50508.1 ADP-ribosyltransferase exoenzyme [Bacteriovorax sp. DB6_IX]